MKSIVLTKDEFDVIKRRYLTNPNIDQNTKLHLTHCFALLQQKSKDGFKLFELGYNAGVTSHMHTYEPPTVEDAYDKVLSRLFDIKKREF